MGHLFMVVHVLEMESKKVTGHRCFFSLILISLLKSSLVVVFFFFCTKAELEMEKETAQKSERNIISNL